MKEFQPCLKCNAESVSFSSKDGHKTCKRCDFQWVILDEGEVMLWRNDYILEGWHEPTPRCLLVIFWEREL
jgi:hypothetical protein